MHFRTQNCYLIGPKINSTQGAHAPKYTPTQEPVNGHLQNDKCPLFPRGKTATTYYTTEVFRVPTKLPFWSESCFKREFEGATSTLISLIIE